MPTPNALSLSVSDAVLTRVLNVQDADGGKIDEVVLAIFELGLKQRERSIAAVAKRKADEAKAAQLDKFNDFVKQGMKIEDALMYAGLAVAKPAETPAPAAAPAAPAKKAA